jgi:hypothetical protein
MPSTAAAAAAAMAKEKEMRDSWWKREKEREEEVVHHRQQREREQQHLREQERERENMIRDERERRGKEMVPGEGKVRSAREREVEMRTREREREMFMQHQAQQRERDPRETREQKYVSASVMGVPPGDIKPVLTGDREMQLQQQQHRMGKHLVGGYRAPPHPQGPPGIPTSVGYGHTRTPSGSASSMLDPRDREKRNVPDAMFGAPPSAAAAGYRSSFYSPASASEEHSYVMMERERAAEREKERERDGQREREREREREKSVQARQQGALPRTTTTPVGMPGVLPAGTPSVKPVKQQAIEVLNQPSSAPPAAAVTERNPVPVVGRQGVKGTLAQEVFSPTDTAGSHAQQPSASSVVNEQPSGKAASARPKLDHAANEAEQAHRRQSNTHAPLGHGLPSTMSAPQVAANVPANSSKSMHKRKRSDVYPPATSLAPDDEVQIVGVTHAPQNRLVGDDGLGRIAPGQATGSRKKSSKHHSHAPQQAVAAPQPVQNPQPTYMPALNQINPQSLSVPPSRHLQVRSDAIEHYLRILGIEALRKHLGRVVYRGTDFLVDGELLASHVGGTLDVDIPGTFLPYHADGSKAWCLRNEVEDWIEEVSPSGKAVLNAMPGYADRQLWGTDVYTDDSDLLAVLVHAAWLRPILPSKGALLDSVNGQGRDNKRARNANDDLRVRLRIAPKLVRYVATERAGILSRGWGNSHDGVSIVVESIERIKVSLTSRQSRVEA